MIKKLFRIFIFPYTIFILYMMFFGMGRTQYPDYEIRLIPFYSTITNLMETYALMQMTLIVIGNIVLFIPFGFLGWIYLPFRNQKTLLLSFLGIITLLEILQCVSKLGVFDIDDIILNTFAVYLGYKICFYVEEKFTRLVL